MARTKFSYEKRQKELAKKQKKEAKRLKKQERAKERAEELTDGPPVEAEEVPDDTGAPVDDGGTDAETDDGFQ